MLLPDFVWAPLIHYTCTMVYQLWSSTLSEVHEVKYVSPTILKWHFTNLYYSIFRLVPTVKLCLPKWVCSSHLKKPSWILLHMAKTDWVSFLHRPLLEGKWHLQVNVDARTAIFLTRCSEVFCCEFICRAEITQLVQNHPPSFICKVELELIVYTLVPWPLLYMKLDSLARKSMMGKKPRLSFPLRLKEKWYLGRVPNFSSGQRSEKQSRWTAVLHWWKRLG